MADAHKCWKADLTATVFLNPIAGPQVPPNNLGITGGYIPEIGPVRLPRLPQPTMVHVFANTPEACVEFQVCRVVECPSGCDFHEFKYEFCTGSSPHVLLPAGLYEITICSQMVNSLEEGDTFEATVLLEPVGNDFAHIFRINEDCC